MAKVVKQYTRDEMQAMRGQRGTPKDDLLRPYMEMLGPLEPGNGLELELDEGETQRVVKRRLTVASKVVGKQIRWRTASDDHLLFEVIAPASNNNPKKARKPPTPKTESD